MCCLPSVTMRLQPILNDPAGARKHFLKWRNNISKSVKFCFTSCDLLSFKYTIFSPKNLPFKKKKDFYISCSKHIYNFEIIFSHAATIFFSNKAENIPDSLYILNVKTDLSMCKTYVFASYCCTALLKRIYLLFLVYSF